jgi:formylglycine-generating enzyme required for sulfatase activity
MNNLRVRIAFAVALGVSWPLKAGLAQNKTDAKPKGASSDLVGNAAGEVREQSGFKIKLIWCPPGKFTMGSPQAEADRRSSEDQTEVTFTKGFWLGQTELNQGNWQAVMKTKPWKGEATVKEGADFPATKMSWNDAAEFCKKLTEQERKAKRLPADWEYALPTEAQWEYACRAGTTTAFSFGDDRAQMSDYAWWGGLVDSGNAEKEQYVHKGGLKKPNAWGFFDMHGNVYEWCRDRYSKKLAGGDDPTGPATGENHVYRGGSWVWGPDRARSAFRRSSDLPDEVNNDLGFRVALVSVGK